ncbi:MAG: TetR/AcrR family transcriptional regulator [Gemmatimonadales bacterium]
MSPRPRTVDDAAIAEALGRVITRHGPAGLTLAAIAREAGLSPATLVQRFGSKRNLLVKLSGGAGDIAPLVKELRAAGRPPLDIVREVLLCYADMAPTPTAMIHSFSAYLEIDLADATLRRLLVESGRRNETEMASLLEEAADQGALVCPDPRGLARVLFALVAGSLLSWATFREGKSRDWLARDLLVVLALTGRSE